MAGLLDHARTQPDKPAFIIGDTGFVETFGELEKRSRQIAHWLQAQGLRNGDCVAMLIGNSPALFDVYWATQRIGLYLTPMNWHSDATELAFIVRHCDAKMLITEPEQGKLAQQLRAIVGDEIAYASIGGDIPGFTELTPEDFGDTPLTEQPAGSVMIYSSGTTGRPKGIRRPLSGRSIDDRALVDATTLVMRTFGFQQTDVYLCPAPLYHAGPLRSCSAMQMLGATVVAMQRFDAATVLSLIEQYRISVAQFVPTHFKRLLELGENRRKEKNIGSLRAVVHAAAPCPPIIKQAMIDWWGPIILEYYAGTEGGGVLINTDEWLQRPGSVGRPWEGLSVAVRDDRDEMVTTPHLEGPIYFRNSAGAVANFAYYKDPAATAAAYHGDWFTLGDIGYFDEEGFLFLTDRMSNMIISGGVNIYPQETEDLLMSHAKVSDVAVIGVPDEDMGEAVKALVVPAPGIAAEPALAEELIQYARGALASFKCPRTVDFVETLPRTATGKLQKRLIRAKYWENR